MSVSRSTIRYAAKQCYQLCMMTGRQACTTAGLNCFYVAGEVHVYQNGIRLASIVPAKCWINL